MSQADEPPTPDEDSWSDDPLAPQEPGTGIPGARGPSALMDPELRREIEHEILYQETIRELKRGPAVTPVRKRTALLLFLVSLFLFVISFYSASARWLGQAIAVLLLHEFGHFLGMKLFGYRNVRVFFIPFFGAAVSGKHETAAAWKQAVTLLLGPIPGIVLGLTLYSVSYPSRETWLFDFCLMLVGLNAFNLLPIIPLDGGRLFEVLFLARRPWPGTLYRLAAVVCLLLLAYTLNELAVWIGFGVMATLVLLATPISHLLARSKRALRQAFPNMPEQIEQLSGEQLRQIFAVVRRLRPFDTEPFRLAAVMRDLHGQAAARPASAGVSTILMCVYIAGIALTVHFVLLAAQAESQRAQALVEQFQEVSREPLRPQLVQRCLQQWESASRPVQEAAYERILKLPEGKTGPGRTMLGLLRSRLPWLGHDMPPQGAID